MSNLRQKWFEILDRVYKETQGLNSGVDCMSKCDGRCCPRRSTTRFQHTGFIIFLPYELEYIASIKNQSVMELEDSWSIHKTDLELPGDEILSVCWTRSCPFLNRGLCGIHDTRPFDCVSFPILSFVIENQVKFSIAEKCPLSLTVSKDFQDTIQEVWIRLYLELPVSWWNLVEQLVISNSSLTFEHLPGVKYLGIDF